MLAYDKIVLFGDSLIQFSVGDGGLTPRLMNHYQRQLDILVRGFSGYNTEWCKDLLQPVLEGVGPGKIAAVVIFLGTNDAAAQGSLQHVSVEQYQANLQHMAEVAAQFTSKVVLVGTAIMNEKNPAQEPGLRTNHSLFNYGHACRRVANDLGIPFVDLASEIYKSLGVSDYNAAMPGDADYTGDISVDGLVPDGLHFSADAYKIFFDALLRALDIPAEQTVMPQWRSISGAHDIKYARTMLERRTP